jgi:MFS family permease
VLSLVANAIVNWNPPFYSRTYGLHSGDIGMWLALFYALPLAVGTFLGGAVGDRLGRRDVRWYLWLPGLAALAALPMALVQYNTSVPAVSFALSIGPAFSIGMYIGPCYGVTQLLVPIRMRALACSVLLMTVSIVGVGVGPLLTGIVSDHLQAQGYGPGSLGRALTLVTLFQIPGGIFLLLAGRRLPEHLASHSTAGA